MSSDGGQLWRGVSARMGAIQSGLTAGFAGRALVALFLAAGVWVGHVGTAHALAAPGTIWTVAGDGLYGTLGNGGPATSGEVAWPWGAVSDSSGDIFIADAGSNVAQMVAGSNCSSNCPYGLSSTIKGDMYVVAGSNAPGNAGSGGPATSAHLSVVSAAALDPQDDLLIATQGDSRVWLVAREDCSYDCSYGLTSMVRGYIYSIAGNGTAGDTRNPGAATDAALNQPEGLAVDQYGDLAIADEQNNKVWLVTDTWCYDGCPFGLGAYTKGQIYPIVLSGSPPRPRWAKDGPLQVAFDAEDDLLVGYNSGVELLAATSCAYDCQYGLRSMIPGQMYTVAGDGQSGFSGDGRPANGPDAGSVLNSSSGIAIDGVGDLLIADYGNHRVRMVPDVSCSSACPFGLPALHKGFTYTVAGNGKAAGTGPHGFTGDGLPATSAELDTPYGLGIASNGNLIIADTYGERVRMVATNDPPPVCYEIDEREAGKFSYGGATDQEDVVVYAPAGLRSISNPIVVNGSAPGRTFVLGTKGPVIINATKTNQHQSLTGSFKATDMNGRYSFCGFDMPAD